MPQHPWDESLPVLIHEGTGYMHPLQKPSQEYVDDDRKKKEIRARSERINKVVRRLFSYNLAFKAGGYDRPQIMLDYVENTRLSKFYRDSTHIYSREFLDHGYNICEFTWMKSTGGDKWKWGASLRDVVYKNSSLKLHTSQEISSDELNLSKSILRQLPPKGELVYGEPADIGALRKRVQALQYELDILTYERKHDSVNESVDIYYRQNFMSHEKFISTLKSDISSTPEIFKTTLIVEVFTKDIVVIRMRVDMNIPTEKALEDMDREAKSKKKVVSSMIHVINGASPFEKSYDSEVLTEITTFPYRQSVTWSSLAQEDSETVSYQFKSKQDKRDFISALDGGYQDNEVSREAKRILENRDSIPFAFSEDISVDDAKYASELNKKYQSKPHIVIAWDNGVDKLYKVYEFKKKGQVDNFAMTMRNHVRGKKRDATADKFISEYAKIGYSPIVLCIHNIYK
jgi:hypothetical protein